MYVFLCLHLSQFLYACICTPNNVTITILRYYASLCEWRMSRGNGKRLSNALHTAEPMSPSSSYSCMSKTFDDMFDRREEGEGSISVAW